MALLEEEKSLFGDARILRVTSDEEAGELMILAELGDGRWQEVIYEGMCYSQLDESSCGLFVKNVAALTLDELKQQRYQQAVNRLHAECPLGEVLLLDMQKRGSRFFLHHTDGGEYIVLARRLCFGETRQMGGVVATE